MKKIMTNVALILLFATGTVFAQSTKKSTSTQSDMQSPKAQMDTTKSKMKGMQEQTGQMQIKDTMHISTQSNTQNQKAEMDTTQSGMNRTQQSMNQMGTKDSTQTQGNSAGGTSAWPMATGTAGGTMEKSDTLTNKNNMQSSSGNQQSTGTQPQGNSAGGTSAWPQSTGTAASTTPDSTNQNGNVADSSGKKMKGDKKKNKKGNKPDGTNN